MAPSEQFRFLAQTYSRLRKTNRSPGGQTHTTRQQGRFRLSSAPKAASLSFRQRMSEAARIMSA